ncbi:hypothetical protein BASA61_009690 [Batrachochytrium salamandrivorans]|nr:hypothetical protein BASA61_009690 [Batrachochytrium salamandrivorans]
MQFFHLFSFVVVASYAAALPQPAGLSEKYSKNADTTLASGLEARSYQPGSNSQKNSATLVSLKRRDNSGSNPNPFSVPFTDSGILTINLASTIDKARYGSYSFLRVEKEAGRKIKGPVGDMLARYIGMSTYVNAALNRWEIEWAPDIRGAIKSGLGDDKYSKVLPGLKKSTERWKYRYYRGAEGIFNDAEKISKGSGSATDHLQHTEKLAKLTLHNHMSLLWELISLLKKFEDGKTLLGHLIDINRSVSAFFLEHTKLYDEVMAGLKAIPSQ